MDAALVPYAELRDRVRAVLGAGGDHADPALELAANALVEGQALGNSRFGLGLLSQLDPALHRSESGQLRLPRVAEQTGGRVILDGSGCFGPLAVAAGARLLGDLVADHGIAVVATRSLAGMGRLAPYVEAVARRGALALAGAASSPAVAPYGGNAPFLGTNPFALALPAGGGEPLVLDIASSAATMAEVHRARDEGYALPEDVAVDASGAPTTSAAEISAVLPRGGLIGTLIGMAVEGITNGVTGEASHNSARTVTMVAIQATPDGGDDLRRRLFEAGGREPSSRARAVIEQARQLGVPLDQIARDNLARLEA